MKTGSSDVALDSEDNEKFYPPVTNQHFLYTHTENPSELF